MGELYQRIERLCKERSISIYQLCQQAGIRTSVLSDLKAGRKKGLNSGTISKLAACLHVSTDAILSGENRLPEDEELNEYLEELKDAKLLVFVGWLLIQEKEAGKVCKKNWLQNLWTQQIMLALL